MFCKKCTLKNNVPLKTPKQIIVMLLKQSSLHVQVPKTSLNLCSVKELGLLPLIRDGMLAVLCRSHSSILLGFSSSSQIPNNTPESRRHYDNLVLAQEHNTKLSMPTLVLTIMSLQCLPHSTFPIKSKFFGLRSQIITKRKGGEGRGERVGSLIWKSNSP